MKNSLTILICVHSTSEFHDSLLSQALKSLENQTYKIFDVLLVLDGCWDETKKKINSENYQLNLKVVEKEKKEGLSYAKNFGLNFIDTEWIGFLDADDYYLPDKLKKQIEYIENNYVDFLGTFRWNINRTDDNRMFETDYNDENYIEHEQIKEILPKKCILTHGSMLIKTECLKSLGGYRDKRGWEDYDLWLRALENNFIFHQVPERLYVYRIGTSVPL